MKHSTDAAGVARQAFADLHDLQTGNDAALLGKYSRPQGRISEERRRSRDV